MQEVYDFEWEMEHDAFMRAWRLRSENESISGLSDWWDPDYLAYVEMCDRPYICPHGYLPRGNLLRAELTEWPEGDIPQPEGVLDYRMRRIGIIY